MGGLPCTFVQTVLLMKFNWDSMFVNILEKTGFINDCRTPSFFLGRFF